MKKEDNQDPGWFEAMKESYGLQVRLRVGFRIRGLELRA